ncbi:Exonuclease I Exo1 [Schizosaccharomyces pombe]
MGIKGLLGLLKPMQKSSHVEEFSGKTLGVDGYVWLHKAVFTCAHELAFNKETDKYLKYAIHQALMLQYYGVKPLIVFDGGPLPCKASTEQKRKGRRQEAFELGKKLWDEDKKSQAIMQFSRCVDVTPEMAWKLIIALREHGIESIVAPYEADAQLVYLEKENIIDGIITEDSDMLVFGAQTVLFKMDGFGNCITIRRNDIANAQDLNLRLPIEKLRHMAIFSGCDYTDGVAGMGLKTALRYLQKYPEPRAAIRAMRLDKSLKVPVSFEKEFALADLAFRHQRVYCPKDKTLVHLSPPERELSVHEDAFIGSFFDNQLAIDIAEGRSNPITKCAFDIKDSSMQSSTKTTITISKRKGISKTDISNFFMKSIPPSKRPTKSTSLIDVTNVKVQRTHLANDISSEKQSTKSASEKAYVTPKSNSLKPGFGKSLSDISNSATKNENVPFLPPRTGVSKYFKLQKNTEKEIDEQVPSQSNNTTPTSAKSDSASPQNWFSSFSYQTPNSASPPSSSLSHTLPISALAKIGHDALNRKNHASLPSRRIVYKPPSSPSTPISMNPRPKGILSLQQYKFR